MKEDAVEGGPGAWILADPPCSVPRVVCAWGLQWVRIKVGAGSAHRPGPSGVRVDGWKVAQAVVEGPVGEEATVFLATGHDVFRGLWGQHWGAGGLGQGFIACVGTGWD